MQLSVPGERLIGKKDTIKSEQKLEELLKNY